MLKLIVIRGPPGSGKSTISLEVGKKLKGKTIVFNKDAFIIGLKVFNTSEKINDKGFTFPIINANLKNKFNVIIDGIYGGEKGAKKLEKLRILAAKHGAKFYVFTLNCSFKTSVKRVRARKGHIVGKSFPLKEIKKWYDYLYEVHYKKGIELDTEKLSLSQVVEEILKLVG